MDNLSKKETPHVNQPAESEGVAQRAAKQEQVVENDNEEQPEVQNKPLGATQRSGSKFDLQG